MEHKPLTICLFRRLTNSPSLNPTSYISHHIYTFRGLPVSPSTYLTVCLSARQVSIDDSISTAGSVISEAEQTRIKEGINARIYVCSTMWHETANEMVQVLKSIMRSVTGYYVGRFICRLISMRAYVSRRLCSCNETLRLATGVWLVTLDEIHKELCRV